MITRWPPGVLLGLLLVELAGLVALFVARLTEWRGFTAANLPSVYADTFPIVAPWAGAVGGVTMGLFGLAKHWSSMATLPPDLYGGRGSQGHRHALRRAAGDRRRWNVWYLLRLPIGMALGTVGALIVVFVAGTVATAGGGGLDVTPRGSVLVGLIAFAVGYRQNRFEELLTRVFDVIGGPGETRTKKAEGVTVEPAAVVLAAAPGSTATSAIVLANGGEHPVAVEAEVTGRDRSQFTVRDVPAEVAPGATLVAVVAYGPESDGPHHAELVVTTGSVDHRVSLSGTGGPAAGRGAGGRSGSGRRAAPDLTGAVADGRTGGPARKTAAKRAAPTRGAPAPAGATSTTAKAASRGSANGVAHR